MATLTPVEHDPFATADAGGDGGGGMRLTPVDHDPFAAPKESPLSNDGPRPSLARPMIGTADASQAPQKPAPERSASQDLLQSHYDTEAALKQRAAPLVRDFSGKLVRKVIGEIEEFDFGPAIRTPDGGLLAFNQTSDVMLRDPQTGKLMAFERAKDMDNPGIVERVGRAILPGFMTTAPTRLATSSEVPMAVQRGRALGFPVSAKTAQTGERMQDAAAFNQLDMEPFAPAFRSKGAARVARTIEEIPVVGGVVKHPKAETEAGLANAHASIAADLGAAQTDEAAGRVLQQGLERFKTAGVQQIEPGILAARGIEPREAVQPRSFMSGPAMERAADAQPIREGLGGGVAQTSRGVAVPAARPLDQTIIARRGADSLSDAELDVLVRTPARDTSFLTRQEVLFEKAWRSIPERFRIDASRNPERLAAPNTRAALSGIDDAIANQIAGQRTITGDLAERIRNPRSHFDMNDMRAMRTEVGRALSSMDPNQTRLNSTQLRGLYGALSRDIEVGLQDIANRAYLMTRAGGNRPDRVAAEAARRADQALRDFRVADRYTRLGMDRMSRFSRVMGADSPEAAMRGLTTKIREGTIDRGTVRAVSDALRPDEREQVLGYLISSMGKGRPGAKEAEAGWNVSHFATDWNKNKVALRILARDTDPAIMQRLEALATRVAARMKYYETTKNYSGSAYAGIPFLGTAVAMAHSIPGAILATLGMAGGTAATGKFLTNPKYLDWMIKAAMTGDAPVASGPQVGGTKIPALLTSLEQIAANDNELGAVVRQAVADFRRQSGEPANVDSSGDGQPRRPVNVKQ